MAADSVDEGPQRNQRHGARDGRRVAVRPGLLAVLIGLLAMAIMAGALWSRIFRTQVGVWNVLLLGLFALLAAAVLSGVLGATGMVKTAKQQIGGAAAIFLATFGALVTAARQLEPHSVEPRSVTLHLLVTGLRDGEQAQVSLPGGCSVDAVGPVGAVEFPLGPSCDNDPLLFSVTVSGHSPSPIIVKRGDATEGKPIELAWKRAPTEPVIDGTIFVSESKVLRQGRVILAGCPAAKPADIDANNGGFRLRIPEDCNKLPPYTLILLDAPGEYRLTAASQTGNQLQIPTARPASEPVAGPGSAAGSGTTARPLLRCHIDRDYWALRPCKRVLASEPPNADELRRLRVEFPQCGEFILDKCAPE